MQEDTFGLQSLIGHPQRTRSLRTIKQPQTGTRRGGRAFNACPYPCPWRSSFPCLCLWRSSFPCLFLYYRNNGQVEFCFACLHAPDMLIQKPRFIYIPLPLAGAGAVPLPCFPEKSQLRCRTKIRQVEMKQYIPWRGSFLCSEEGACLSGAPRRSQ